MLSLFILVSASTAQDARPGVRAHHCLVYDESRAAVVLAGGTTPVNDDFVFYDDLWSFDGAAWSRIGTLGQPLSDLRLAYYPEAEAWWPSAASHRTAATSASCASGSRASGA